jgi:ribonuclease P/MRP protein subunit POP1
MKEDNTPTHTFRRRKKSGHDRLRKETAEKLRKMGKKKEIVERLIEEAAERKAAREEGGTLKRPPRAHSRFRKRQRGKTWLPTHVWHAKRAHMEVRWRFAVVESPNEKCYRSTQRAVDKRGGVAWDVSYWSSILLRGDEEKVGQVLEAVCRDGTGDKKVRMGRRTKECWAYERGGYPSKPIGPVTVVWSPTEGEGADRKILIRVHPSAFYKVWEELLAVIKDHNPASSAQKVFIEDMRFELGSIHVAGPSATDALLSVLTPINAEGETEKVWSGLRGLANPSALPPGVVFGFEISDPRLRFPPRLESQALSEQQQQQKLFEIQSTWPVPAIPFSLLDVKKRTVAVKLQASQKRISKRKSAAPPGQFPELIPNDPKIPILLLSSPLSTTGGTKTGAGAPPGTWTLVLPWKWVQPVWYALMHTQQHIRFGGIQEAHNSAFDHSLPWFPADFPGTGAGKSWENEQSAGRKEAWEKRPKQKRLNYEAIKIAGAKGELGDWSRCDWGLLTTPTTSQMDIDAKDNELTTSSILASAETVATESTAPAAAETKKAQPWWQLPSHLVTAFLQTKKLPPSLVDVALENAVFNVKITLLHRGSPTAPARIYKLSDTSPWHTLRKALQTKRKGKGKFQKKEAGIIEAGEEGYPESPGEEDLVGFVTTGNYSLSEGKPLCIGGIMWGLWFTDEKKVAGERWCVVRDVGTGIGRLGRWEVA